MTSSSFIEVDSFFSILEAIKSFQGEWFTSREIAEHIGRAKRTLDAYLKYLVDDRHLLERERSPRTGGAGEKPYRYRYVSRYPTQNEMIILINQLKLENDTLKKENRLLRQENRRLSDMSYGYLEDYA
jgi:predicted transcriptional regulator